MGLRILTAAGVGLNLSLLVGRGLCRVLDPAADFTSSKRSK